MWDPIESDVGPIRSDEANDENGWPIYVYWIAEIYDFVMQLTELGWECESVSSQDESGSPFKVTITMRRDRGTDDGIV